MKTVLNKFHVGLVFFSVVVLSVVVLLISPSELCTVGGVRNSSCSEIASRFVASVVFSLVLFVPYVVSLLINPKYFEIWIKFAVWAIPSVFFLTLFTTGVESRGFADVLPLILVSAPYLFYFLWSIYLGFKKS